MIFFIRNPLLQSVEIDFPMKVKAFQKQSLKLREFITKKPHSTKQFYILLLLLILLEKYK